MASSNWSGVSVLEAELGVDGFTRAHHLARVVDREHRHQPLQVGDGRGLFEIADVLGPDGVLVEDGERRAALGALVVDVELCFVLA